jgi:hypothetical protein
MEQGFIYEIKCRETGKKYIGQAKEFKSKKGKPFRYGIQGRWSDHLSNAKQGASTMPLCEAIQTYGATSFEVKELQQAPMSELDALEAQWIERTGSVVPNGYNVCTHSRNRHRTSSSLAKHYIGRVDSVILRPVRRDGEYKLMYAMLTLHSGETERITFGQKQEQTFQAAKDEAFAFVTELGCPFQEETSNSYDPLERYATKLKQFEEKVITRIRVTTASGLVAVYITTSEAKSYKDQMRICFGGKAIPPQVAYELAQLFIQALPKHESTILEDIYRSPQQVAASKAETEP